MELFLAILLYIVILTVSIVVQYYIIKHASKNGVGEVLWESSIAEYLRKIMDQNERIIKALEKLSKNNP